MHWSTARLIRQNLRRNLRHNLLSAIGIIVGIAAFTFFLALDGGVRKVVLGEIFPVDRIEVVPPKSTLFGSARNLTDDVVARLRNPPQEKIGVKPKAAYAKMKLAFPARGWGGKGLIRRNRDFYFEVSGFCDGVDEEIMAEDVTAPFSFVDWLAKDKPQKCAKGSKCPEGYYCAWDLYQCHKPVPVVVSKYMLELYNGSIAPTHPNLPKIPDFVTSVFLGKTFTVELGRSYLGSTATRGGRHIHRRFQLVGLSDKAIPLGITVPIGYVKRWNKRYAGDEQSEQYSSVVVVVDSKRDITPIAAYVKGMGFDLAESEGEKVGLFITLATVLFTLISVMIVLIAAINIAHTFMMLISERRWEIGVLRAIGATRASIRWVIMGEAGVVGLLSGGIGLAMAYAAAWACDWYSANRIPDFPFKPDSYFLFTPLLVGGAIGFAALFCLLGAFLPANRAARMEPASALTMR